MSSPGPQVLPIRNVYADIAGHRPVRVDWHTQYCHLSFQLEASLCNGMPFLENALLKVHGLKRTSPTFLKLPSLRTVLCVLSTKSWNKESWPEHCFPKSKGLGVFRKAMKLGLPWHSLFRARVVLSECNCNGVFGRK